MWVLNMRRTSMKEALSITNKLIDDIIFLCETRTKSTYFTRAGKFNFKNTIMFALNFVKKSIQLELDSFFKNIIGSEITITKQGYSEARQKISPTAFIKMANAIVEWFYAEDDFKTFLGYRLSAIDGSILEMNNSARLREAFGYVENKSVKVARALASGIYDIENDMMITTRIAKYNTSERDLAIEMMEQLKQFGLKNDLILFDRGYPSLKFVTYVETSGIKYVMRATKHFLKTVKKAEEDQIIEVKSDGKAIQIRVLQFLLDSGVEEILVTNVLDKNMGIKEFKKLYFKRWGIETKYDELKNRLQIENFTGDTAIAVEQDFYASIYLSNMAAIAKAEANRDIEEKNEGKKLKYQYRVNANILIGKLKDSLVLMLLEDNLQKRSEILEKVMKEISRNIIPIRPGRSYERKLGLKANRHPINQKSSL